MISIICVYNNKKKLNDFLLNGLRNQTVHNQLHLVDNTNNSFKSAAEALNYGAKDAEGKYIMFVHQDVDLSSSTWLEDTEKMLDKLPLLGIAGVAGATKHIPYAISNIKHGVPPRPAGEVNIISPVKVQTLDECLVIIPKEVFKKIKFDESTCDNWHLYTVDYALSIKKIGFNVILLPQYLYHLSEGQLSVASNSYYTALTRVLKKHRKHIFISTTCGSWFTFLPVKMQLWFPIWFLKERIPLILQKRYRHTIISDKT